MIEERETEIQNLDEKYKTISKDNDNFVTMINSEIGELMLLFESLQFNKGGNQPYSNSKTVQKQFNKNSQLSFKYELINKNIEIFRNKIVENHQTNSQNVFKLEKSLKEAERNYKEIFSERDSLIKENSLKHNTLNEIVRFSFITLEREILKFRS